MEAPEKIYIQPNAHDAWFESNPQSDIFIEYTRTDAFIEKAGKFLEDNLTEKDCKFNWGDWTKVKSGETPITSFMKEFRRYMKGE